MGRPETQRWGEARDVIYRVTAVGRSRAGRVDNAIRCNPPDGPLTQIASSPYSNCTCSNGGLPEVALPLKDTARSGLARRVLRPGLSTPVVLGSVAGSLVHVLGNRWGAVSPLRLRPPLSRGGLSSAPGAPRPPRCPAKRPRACCSRGVAGDRSVGTQAAPPPTGLSGPSVSANVRSWRVKV